MSTPTTRTEFKNYCLRALGSPVIEINVSDEQIDDRIDEALKFYMDYHFDGAEKTYYKHQITAQDKTNRYITLPENIIGAVRVFNPSTLSGSRTMFDIRYQLVMNELYTLTNTSLVPYYMTMQHITFLEQMLVGEKPIRFNRHTDKLWIDMDWSIVVQGDYLLVEAYSIVDPETYPDVWGDRWLAEYASALIKRQWGNNMKKFGNMQMPGGGFFNGQVVFDEASGEIISLRSEMLSTYSLPAADMIG